MPPVEPIFEALSVCAALHPDPMDEMDDDDEIDQCKKLGLTKAVPEAIRKMIGCKGAIEALGSMIW